ncbi:MAG TPA: GtrA family protein [Actinomycetota bacterium]|jgi:putative flippase GtrA|nr:GtrA family protein [Actinomycetota bacterium]
MATRTQTSPISSSKRGRFLGFLAVGATGLVINQLAFWLLTDVFGLYYLWGFLLATQFSTAWNFVLLERYVFDGRREGRWARLGWYALMNNIWNVASAPVMVAITSGLGVPYLWANWLVITGMTLVRFAISNRLIWGTTRSSSGSGGGGVDATGVVPSTRRGTWSYDIHGIVLIASETPLPELERFEVPELATVPDIDVTVSNRGFGGIRRRVLVTEQDGEVTYIEHLGRFGFAAKIDVETLSRIQVSKLLRRSPHVAYTNVVEPVVRWLMVRKGYILAHAACLQIDGHGVLITARTDTGKTTTCLKSIKEQGSGFVSDDMVIIDPEGHALSYPKPLTISSHTLHAVKGAPMPTLTRAALQLQGRIHSKFGRSVGMAIGNVNLPVATMSALVQMAVPPPKFHVDRLIPEAELVNSLDLDRLVVIERGEALLRELDEETAFEILSENTEDAYGFPPYPRIEDAFTEGYVETERAIRRKLIGRVEAVQLRTPDRNWFERLPQLAAGIAVPFGVEVVRVDDAGDVMLDLTGVGADLQDVESEGEVIALDTERHAAELIASRFAQLSPDEAEEVERALSAALTLLQKVSDILDQQSDREAPAVSGLVASVRSLRDARITQGKR